ncbi:YhjD/YihY/BrkB family envelope integrity protein [Micromonospora sp. CPCC 206060]
MNVFGSIEAHFGRQVTRARRRSAAFDHLWRALTHYNELIAGRLAAAIAYYGFFAVFALALVGYWVFGAVLENSDEVSVAAADFLRENLPFIDPAQIQESSGTVGVVGLVILVFTGVGWVEAIRSSQRLIYGLRQQPGNLVVRWLVDLGVLFGVFVLLGVSVAAVDTLESFLRWLLRSTGSIGLTTVSAVLSVLVNLVLAAALLVAVPRLRISRRRLRPAVLLVAVGITLLNTVGRYYVVRTERNPAYTVVAGAVGLLLYLYLLNQLVLFGAALAATSRYGRVVDLALAGLPSTPGQPVGPGAELVGPGGPEPVRRDGPDVPATPPATPTEESAGPDRPERN